MRYKAEQWIGIVLLLSMPGLAAAVSAPECRALQTTEVTYQGPERFDHGILWQIERDGMAPSHVFGTIHVADEDILDLPAPVESALSNSAHFAMEALPNYAESLSLSRSMFFDNGQHLDEMLSESLFGQVVEILEMYYLTKAQVRQMKPWAAFITISYPPDLRQVLDLVLMQTAANNGAELHGLEGLTEQAGIFNQLDMQDQVRLLADAACHYDTMQEDFEIMKSLYLQRDLKGMYRHGQNRTFEDNSVYDFLTRRLLQNRNHLMVDRMQPLLDEGNAFIAVGAMHLPGKEGILSLLEERGYRITKIY